VESEVTFIIIAFNEVTNVTQCIESIFNQESDSNFLITLVDDGSTDGTADLVEREFPERVKVIRQRNSGRGLARLTGILSTNSTYIAMVDSDICLPKNWLSRCLSEISNYQGVGGIAVPDGDSSTISRLFDLKTRATPGSINLTGNNSLFKTEVLKEIGTQWVTRLGEDFRLQRLLEQHGHKTSRIENLFVEHMEHKSFIDTFSWFFDSGKDATKLWFTFKITRMPDIAFFGFLSLLLAAPVLFLTFGPKAMAIVPIFLLLIGLAQLCLKFKVEEKPFNALVAWIPNSILMCSYLLGRTYGLFLLSTSWG